jgi:hypothetical protein
MMVSPPQEPQQGMPQTPRALWGWWLVLLVGLLLGVAGASFAAAPRSSYRCSSAWAPVACESLDQLAQALLHEETLGQEALVRLLGPRPTMTEEKPE